ncbi:MAG: hypothetical protein AAF485_00600 [Chloroflexota bacterium]
MTYLVGGAGLVLLLSFIIRKYNTYKFHQENALRETLGLPPLTRHQYDIDIPENARNTYRGVNFHM